MDLTPCKMALVVALTGVMACGDDGDASGDSGSPDSTTGGETDPSAGPGDTTLDPTAQPTTTTPTTGATTTGDTDSGSPSTGDESEGDSTGAPTAEGSSTGQETGGAGQTQWVLDVEVDFGGTFDVTADATIAIEEGTFDSDVLTLIIAGGEEEHEIPLAGTVEGGTLTMVDSPFTIVVDGTRENFEVSGEATLRGDTLTGGGTFLAVIDGGEPFAGSWTIVTATPAE